MVRLTCAVALGLLLAPTQALADSDGYYCTGSGYLAFETRFAAGSSGHLLHVVRFSRADGLTRLPPILLEDFQVHGIRCLGDAVELQGGRTIYAVALSDPGGPAIRTRRVAPGDDIAGPTANLGYWAQPGVVDLGAEGAASGEFALVITRVSREVTTGMEHFTSSVLMTRDRRPGPPRVRHSLLLFFGSFLETVD